MEYGEEWGSMEVNRWWGVGKILVVWGVGLSMWLILKEWGSVGSSPYIPTHFLHLTHTLMHFSTPLSTPSHLSLPPHFSTPPHISPLLLRHSFDIPHILDPTPQTTQNYLVSPPSKLSKISIPPIFSILHPPSHFP